MDYPQEHIKPYGNDGKKSEQVEEMFDNIAPAYDKLNHTLSMGIDRSWRKKAIDTLRPFSPRRIMDVATGTGDFAILRMNGVGHGHSGQARPMSVHGFSLRLSYGQNGVS